MSTSEKFYKATVIIEVSDFELPDEKYQHSRPPFQIRPEQVTVAWSWSPAERNWEIDSITVRGPRVKKDGKLSVQYHENVLRLVTYADWGRAQLRHIELAEKHRPELSA